MGQLPSFRTLFIYIVVALALLLGWRLLFAPDNAPQVEYKLIDGNVLSSDDLQNKVVVISFWSTSCSSCIAEMPHLAKMYEDYHARGLEIVAVAVEHDQLRNVVRLAYDKNLPYKVAYDGNGRVVQAWGGIKYTPTAFVVNRRGQVVERLVGPQSDHIESMIKSLL